MLGWQQEMCWGATVALERGTEASNAQGACPGQRLHLAALPQQPHVFMYVHAICESIKTIIFLIWRVINASSFS